MNVLGIDPGAGGGLAVIGDGKVLEMHTTPFLPDGSIDIPGFIHLVRHLVATHTIQHAIIERVHAIFGTSAGSTFSFGQAFAVCEASVVSVGLSYTMVDPKTWQAEVWQGITPIYIQGEMDEKTGKRKKGKTDTKGTSLLAAKRLYPETEFRLESKAGKLLKHPHDGLIDACHLALYGYRMLTRGTHGSS